MNTNRFRQSKLDNGKEVQIILLPAGEGLATATRLFRTFAPSLGAIITTLEEDGSIDFMAIAYTLTEGLEDFDINALVLRLLDQFTINGMQQNFDDYFVANYAELVEILAFALKENFGSFLELRGFAEKYLPMLKPKPTEAE